MEMFHMEIVEKKILLLHNLKGSLMVPNFIFHPLFLPRRPGSLSKTADEGSNMVPLKNPFKVRKEISFSYSKQLKKFLIKKSLKEKLKSLKNCFSSII